MCRRRPPAIVARCIRTIARTIGLRISDAARACVTSRALETWPGRVEAVRAREVRVGQAELPRAGVHHRDESSRRCRCRRSGERVRGVVRALDQRALEQIADRQPLAGREGRSTTRRPRRPRGDGDDIVRLRALERQQNRHQLRSGSRSERARAGGTRRAPGPSRRPRRCTPGRAPAGAAARAGVASESRGDSNQRALHGRND